MKKKIPLEIMCSLSRMYPAPLALLQADMGLATQALVHDAIGELKAAGYKIIISNGSPKEGTQHGVRVAWIEGDGRAEFAAAEAYWVGMGYDKV